MSNFKTKNLQIRLLREKNVNTIRGTGNILIEYNYNELIKKYGTPFIDANKSNFPNSKYKKIYKDGTTVHQIKELLIFDRKLSNILLREMLKIEEKVKSVFIYYLCNKHGEFGIYDKKAYNQHADMQDILKNINYMFGLINKNREKSFVIDDFSKHGKIPSYVLSEFITLGELSKTLPIIDPIVAIETAKHFKISKSQLETFVNLMSKFRNACAHNNVVYCYKFQKASISNTEIHSKYGFKNGDNHSYNHNLFAVLIAIRHFLSKREFNSFLKEIDELYNDLFKKVSVFNKEEILKFSKVPKNYYLCLKK